MIDTDDPDIAPETTANLVRAYECAQSRLRLDAGIVAPLTGLFGVSALSMALVIAGAMVVAVLVLGLGTPAYRRGGWRTDAAYAQ